MKHQWGPLLWATTLALGIVSGCGAGSGAPQTPLANPAAPIVVDASAPRGDVGQAKALTADARASELVRQMTLEEKIAYVGGDREFFIRPIARLGIPEIKM